MWSADPNIFYLAFYMSCLCQSLIQILTCMLLLTGDSLPVTWVILPESSPHHPPSPPPDEVCALGLCRPAGSLDLGLPARSEDRTLLPKASA